MNVLIACERSGVVRDAFRALGHDAWSCDLAPAAGHHLQGDVRLFLDLGWDLMIGHPPCTRLAISGAGYFKGREDEQNAALDFVRLLMDAPIQHIAIENPVSVISTRIREPDQIIQPWQFGDPESKATCLWLKRLPALRPTNILTPAQFTNKGTPRWNNQTANGQNKLGPSADRAMIRATTYAGIANAMAEQWGRPFSYQMGLFD